MFTSDFEGGNVACLVPTDTPLFNVTTLKICPTTGKYLLLAGPKGVNVMQIPGKFGVDDSSKQAGLVTKSIFFCFFFCKKIPCRGITFLLRSSQQLPRLCLGPLN